MADIHEDLDDIKELLSSISASLHGQSGSGSSIEKELRELWRKSHETTEYLFWLRIIGWIVVGLLIVNIVHHW